MKIEAKKTILIISDHEILLQLFDMLLLKEGYSVRAFSQNSPPRDQNLIKMSLDIIVIIITKINHSIFKYFFLFKEYEIFKNIPIILISEHTLNNIKIKNSFVDYYIVLPVLPKIFIKKIQAILEIK